MCPRSGFRSGGTCERTLAPVFVPGETSECTLAPVFVPGEHPPKPPFWKTTLLSTPDSGNETDEHRRISYQNFAVFLFARVCERFRLNFALGDYVHKNGEIVHTQVVFVEAIV